MRSLLAVVLLVAALSGCLDSSGTGLDGPQPIAKVPVHGAVLTPAFNPIAGVSVTLENPGAILDDGTVTADLAYLTAQTDAEGKFSLMSFPGTYRLTLEEPDHAGATMNITVPGDNLTLFMTPVNRIVPYQDDVPFDGYIECGLEALIITPSCDSAVTVTPAEQVFVDDSFFEIEMDEAWQTVVLDVYFDGSDHPGMAGLRASAYEPDADVALNEYPRIRQEWSPEPFTLRIEPGVDYGDDIIAPVGSGGLLFRFFPQGHLSEESPALGVGQATALQFQAIATIFYHEAAPEGWTLHTP